jgi:hypothetical protein
MATFNESEAVAGNDELLFGVIGRWSWFYLHIYATKYVYFWILQRQLARHWGAGVIHAGVPEKKFPNRTMHGW